MEREDRMIRSVDRPFVEWVNKEDDDYPEGQYVEAVFCGHMHENHIFYDVSTDPNAWDTDSDSVADYWEIYNYHTDPTKSDSDNDGAPDWFEIAFIGK